MEIKGILKQTLATETGQGQKGTWIKQVAIIELPGKYPKPLAVTFWGEDMVDRLAGIVVAQGITLDVTVESREHNGRWYTEVRAKGITSDDKPFPDDDSSSTDEPDDLPF